MATKKSTSKERLWLNPDFTKFIKQTALELNKPMLKLKPNDLFKKKKGKRVFADLYEDDFKLKW